MQTEFNIPPSEDFDRNYERGGRSFYFFDLDDNILHSSTKIYLFHKKEGSILSLTPKQLAENGSDVGKSGKYKDFEFRIDDFEGSFRNFRDQPLSFWKRIIGKKQSFVVEMEEIVSSANNWRGPSWKFFEYAVYNSRPVSIITARGHHEKTVKQALMSLKKFGHIVRHPNYHTIYPVSHPNVRKELGDHELTLGVPELKKRAIHASVEKAFKLYGFNDHHRFGMSDDDPKNIELIIEAMMELKREFPKNSFYVFHTGNGDIVREEILVDRIDSSSFVMEENLSLPL